jgi:pimeloyl-ACP methyl ester carboxylesterase
MATLAMVTHRAKGQRPASCDHRQPCRWQFVTGETQLQFRLHGDDSQPALIYLPGVHGDWTLISSLRERMKAHVRFVEVTYPRTLTWSMADYGDAVLEALAEQGVTEGMLLGESFGSQVAWDMLARITERSRSDLPPAAVAKDGSSFRPLGLILAGGFVRYPILPLVDLARGVWRITPAWVRRAFFFGYAHFARWRHRHAPETRAAIHEFIARRTDLDFRAMGHRLDLIRRNDPRHLSSQLELPVFQLAGLIDPIVCYPLVKRWLGRHCPGHRESRLIPLADHNVLSTAPDAAASVILRWMRESRPTKGSHEGVDN